MKIKKLKNIFIYIKTMDILDRQNNDEQYYQFPQQKYYTYFRNANNFEKTQDFDLNLDFNNNNELINIVNEVIREYNWEPTDVINIYTNKINYEITYENGKIFRYYTYVVYNTTLDFTYHFRIKELSVLNDVKGLNLLSIDELKEFFRDIIRRYKWDERDVIIAKAIDGDKGEIKYKDGLLTIS